MRKGNVENTESRKLAMATTVNMPGASRETISMKENPEFRKRTLKKVMKNRLLQRSIG